MKTQCVNSGVAWK